MRCTRLFYCTLAEFSSTRTTGIATSLHTTFYDNTLKGSNDATTEGGHETSLNDRPLTNVVRSFKPLKFHTWQMNSVHKDKSLLPITLLYHGDFIGPRPLLILDHSLPVFTEDASGDGANRPDTPLEVMQKAAAKYQAIVSFLGWDYGAVYVPLGIKSGEANVMDYSCRQVCAVMDALDLRWSHFLTYSYGTLVAARMATSEQYPHRIGSFLSLDTPLVTAALMSNAVAREEITKAEDDVGIPTAELIFAREELLNTLEEPLPCPALQFDQELYTKYLFNPQEIYKKGGLVRKETRYVPVRHLAEMYHPFQLIVPSRDSISDVAIHQDVFNLRRAMVIASAASHEGLFSEPAASEVAEVVRNWMGRFEPDIVLARQYEHAAKEMSQLLKDAAASSTLENSFMSGSIDTRKKKKERKKKNS